MFWTYQNGLCMLIPLGPIQPDGSFDRGVYLYTGPSDSHTPPVWEKRTGFVKVPDDNGDSWTAGNFVDSALFYIEAPAGTNLYEIDERLHKVINNQKRASDDQRGKAEFQDTGSQEPGGGETGQQGTPSAGVPAQPEEPPAGLSGKELKQWRRDHGQG
jgi:hypothetical protein